MSFVEMVAVDLPLGIARLIGGCSAFHDAPERQDGDVCPVCAADLEMDEDGHRRWVEDRDWNDSGDDDEGDDDDSEFDE